jgi:hypothetical protein
MAMARILLEGEGVKMPWRIVLKRRGRQRFGQLSPFIENLMRITIATKGVD